MAALLISVSGPWIRRVLSGARCRLAATALCAALTSSIAAAQGPTAPGPNVQRPAAEAPAGSIRGRVVRSDTRLPVRRARIVLRASSVTDLPVATTDDGGRFELTGLPAGNYRLIASKGGFLMAPEDRGGAAQSTETAGRPLDLAPGQQLDDVEVLLVPGGVIAGQVLDETGAPLAGAAIHARPQQFHDGRPWPHPSAAASDVTDDRGQFRLTGLPPAGYFVSAAAAPPVQALNRFAVSPTALEATFYPGTRDSREARVVYVDAGQQLDGLVFALLVGGAPTAPGVPAGTAAAAPAGATDTRGVLRGRVIQDDGSGIPGARILADGVTDASVLTDRTGRFELRLAPGVYQLLASMNGFVQVPYGQRLPDRPFTSLQITSGETNEDIEIVLPRAGVVAGQVMDERGEPVVNALVQMLERRIVAGRRQAVSGRGLDRTDDRGMFRIFGIPPGSYLLAASVNVFEGPLPLPMVTTGSLTTFYPSTFSEAEAQPLTVGPGDDLSSLVLTLLPGRLAGVSGVIHTIEGTPAADARVTLWQKPAFSATSGWSSRGTRVRADGTFSFANLAPGTYTLFAELPTRRQVAMAPLVLDGVDVTVPLVLQDGHTASGRVVLEGDPELRTSSQAVSAISFDAASPSETFPPTSARPGADSTFEAQGLMGRRVLRVVPRPEWMLKAVRIGNTDLTDVPLDFSVDISGIEVVLTNRIPEISGTVVDAAGRPVANATVVLFPADRRRWSPQSRFVAAATTGPDGRFTRRALPPEDYLAVAVRDFEPGAETIPGTLEGLQLLAGSPFTVEEGARIDLALPVADTR